MADREPTTLSGVVSDLGGPITSTGDDERELVLGWLGDGGENVPFLERGVGNADGSASVKASCNPSMSISR